MRNTSLVLAVLAAILWPRASQAADADLLSAVELTVRTYDSATLEPADRHAALAAAAAILRGAGVEVRWMPCDTTFVRSGADEPCLAPLGPTELAVRFVRLPPPPGHEGTLSLGYSLVDTRRRAGSLATLYVDRVAGLAVTCGIDTGTLLGRAVAHEIGHLLLADRNHAPAGLMRALWSRESIRESDDRTWVFSAQEARAMRTAVRSRAAQRLAIVAGD